jgi:hypothetical protein
MDERAFEVHVDFCIYIVLVVCFSSSRVIDFGDYTSNVYLALDMLGAAKRGAAMLEAGVNSTKREQNYA